MELGANTVIGVRYDANEVMDGGTEVLCYGTAVIMEPAGFSLGQAGASGPD